MRILLTADPELPVPPKGYGGIERIVDALVRRLRARGHAVGLVARTGSTSPADTLFAWPGNSSTARIDVVRNALALKKAARAFRADVVHSFSRIMYLMPLLPSSRPKVMSFQRHTGGWHLALAARLGGPSLHFTACSEYICAMGKQAGGRWTAIHNFVEVERYDFVAQVPADAPLVFLSRIESIKGADLAIAIARASGRRLILAGNRASSGAEAAYWQDKIAPHLDRDGITWVGEVDDAQKNALLGQAAALLVPIQWDEPFGIVFVEALACGTPVLSCARGALPEIVTPGRTGLLFDSVPAGVAAVKQLSNLDRAACRNAAVNRFSADVLTTRYEELYARVTDNAGAR